MIGFEDFLFKDDVPQSKFTVYIWDPVIFVVYFGVLRNCQGCDNEEEAAYDLNLEH